MLKLKTPEIRFKKNAPIVNLVRQSLKFKCRFPHLHAKKKDYQRALK